MVLQYKLAQLSILQRNAHARKDYKLKVARIGVKGFEVERDFASELRKQARSTHEKARQIKNGKGWRAKHRN